jgi:hypothetical protein
MSRSSIFALAAVAALGATALAPSSALAFGRFGGMGGGGFGHGGGMGMGHGPMGLSVHPGGPMGLSVHPRGPMGLSFHAHGPMGVIIHPIGVFPHPVGWIPKPGPHPWPPIGWCGWKHHHCGYPWPPVVIGGGGEVETGPVGVVGTTSAVVGGVPTADAPCTCLTKTYLDDGSVLFKDICTKEAALATPDELKAQAQGVGP